MILQIEGTGRSSRQPPEKCCARGTVLDFVGFVGFRIPEWMPETTRVDPAGHGDVCDCGHCIGFCMTVCDMDMTSWTLCIYTWVRHLSDGMAAEYDFGSEC